jgi:hypothetical protein
MNIYETAAAIAEAPARRGRPQVDYYAAYNAAQVNFTAACARGDFAAAEAAARASSAILRAADRAFARAAARICT